jgi:polynucleotide 5'-hydroxyl-kinase GRC3/NOL9
MLLPARIHTLPAGLDILPEWERAAEAIDADPGIGVLLGASDTGKTTLARHLAGDWTRRGRSVGLVDADIGQSWLGPPTTVGLGFHSAARLVPTALHFVGAISPPGCFLPLILGTQALARRAVAQGAGIVLVDTTGMVAGPIALALKSRKLQALEPRHVLALQRADELEPILHRLDGSPATRIHRLPVSPRVEKRSAVARKAYREARFADYFAMAAPQELAWSALRFSELWLGTGRRLAPATLGRLGSWLAAEPLYGEVAGDSALLLLAGSPAGARLAAIRAFLQVREVTVVALSDLQGVLLGLHDAGGRFLALGLLAALDAAEERISILTPLPDGHAVREVAFGRLRVAPNGQELGEARWR